MTTQCKQRWRIYTFAGDVTGHYQILHFAAEMGKVAGHNAASNEEPISINYDKLMLAVSFDQSLLH